MYRSIKAPSRVNGTVRPVDKPPVFGYYSNDPLVTMSNQNFHKKIKPNPGKYFDWLNNLGNQLRQDLTPWIKDDMFKERVYADDRTGAIAKTSFKNQVMDGVYRERDAIVRDERLDAGIDHLKSLGLLKDNKVYEIKQPRVSGKSWIDNDYHPKVANGGYTRKLNGTVFNR
jgi:hypothetical protein